MKRLILSALCLSGVAFAPPALACACLCLDDQGGPTALREREQREVERADYFFSGYIVKREEPFAHLRFFGISPDETPIRVTIRPTEVLKGPPAQEIVVWENGPATCRAALPKDTGFVKVLAYQSEGALYLSPCNCAESVFDRLADAPP